MKTQTWKEYLYFSRKERIALVVLLIITAVFWLLPRLAKPDGLPPQLGQVVFLQPSGDSVVLYTASADKQLMAIKEPAQFFFNPNTLEQAGWLQLGLSEKVAHTIIHYREKGGRFYKPEDLRKIYGLREEEARRLMPFIRLSDNKLSVPAPVAAYPVSTAATIPASGKHPILTDINTATQEDWKRFPGIGEVLSKRIVAFRNKAGGFCTVAQVAQTYGIADSVFKAMRPFLTVNTTTIPRLNINTASAFQLQMRPSVTAQTADAIVTYRQGHGNYTTIHDLEAITGAVVYQQIFQYFIVE